MVMIPPSVAPDDRESVGYSAATRAARQSRRWAQRRQLRGSTRETQPSSACQHRPHDRHRKLSRSASVTVTRSGSPHSAQPRGGRRAKSRPTVTVRVIFKTECNLPTANPGQTRRLSGPVSRGAGVSRAGKPRPGPRVPARAARASRPARPGPGGPRIPARAARASRPGRPARPGPGGPGIRTGLVML